MPVGMLCDTASQVQLGRLAGYLNWRQSLGRDRRHTVVWRLDLGIEWFIHDLGEGSGCGEMSHAGYIASPNLKKHGGNLRHALRHTALPCRTDG